MQNPNKTSINKFGLPNIVLPAEVIFNNNLTWREKALFGFINNLTANEKGYCWASNRYLGLFLKVRPETISTMISKLNKEGYISLEYETENNGEQTRKIFIDKNYMFKFKGLLQGALRKILRPLKQNLKTPLLKLKDPLFKILSNIDINIDTQLDKNNIYTLFLKKWNEQKIKVHKKITSKRKIAINKVLKLKDYSQEEIFKAFQNYATVLYSPDYYWDHPWTMEEFLQRGLHKFVDEAEPLKTFQNKSPFSKTDSKSPSIQSSPSTLTKESLNLFSDEAENLDDWIKIYSNLVNQWINADIWPNSYQPNKNKIHAALTELKNWVNNLIYGNYYSQIKRVAGSLETICEEYIEWIEEQDWLEEGIKEGSLFPSSEMFKNNFMPALEDKISDYPIRSVGWKNDSDIKMQTPDEIEEERKQNRINKEIMEKKIEQEKRDIDWAYECIERHFADIDLMNMRQIFNVKEFQLLGKQDGWQELFENFIIDIEKKHQTNKGDRRFSYIYLFKNLKNIV